LFGEKPESRESPKDREVKGIVEGKSIPC